MITTLLSEYLLKSMFSSGSVSGDWEVVFVSNPIGTLTPQSVIADLELLQGCDWKTLSGSWAYNEGELASGSSIATLPYLSNDPPSAWDNDSSDAEEWTFTYFCVAVTVGGARRLAWYQELDEAIVVPIGDSLEIISDIEIEIGGT